MQQKQTLKIFHTFVDTFALKTNLPNLKTQVDKLDIAKLKPVPVDLSKLSDVVKNDVVKKDVYNKLVANVDNIDTNDFVLKTNHNTKITKLKNKILDISNLATKTDYNTKVTEIENKLHDHNHDKYDTSEFTNFFNSRLAQANLITKTDFDAKLLNLNRKITQNKSKRLLIEDELNKLKNFDLGYFIGKSRFEEDGTQNYLVFQPIFRYFKVDAVNNVADYVLSWKSKGLSSESIKPCTTSDNSLTPALNYYGNKKRVKFSGSYLKQTKVLHTHRK